MVTVEVDPVRVESRLAAGEIGCPRCSDGVLGGWGYARARWIEGLGGSGAAAAGPMPSPVWSTHVLLPVTVLLRRAYAAERIWAVVDRPRRRGWGIAGSRALRVPAATVRGWLRRAAERLEAIRSWFLGRGAAGVDVEIPDGFGCPWRDVLAAVATAIAAIRLRFGPPGLLGAVTPARVVVAVSGGRLLAPGWPPGLRRRNTSRP